MKNKATSAHLKRVLVNFSRSGLTVAYPGGHYATFPEMEWSPPSENGYPAHAKSVGFIILDGNIGGLSSLGAFET